MADRGRRRLAMQSFLSFVGDVDGNPDGAFGASAGKDGPDEESTTQGDEGEGGLGSKLNMAQMTPAVIATPAVASAAAGHSAILSRLCFVLSPASNRITARVMLPIR